MPDGLLSVSTMHRIGIELIQVRTGPSSGKATYRGVMHYGGGHDAVKREFREVFERMRSSSTSRSIDDEIRWTADDSGFAIRRRMEIMHQVVLKSWKEGPAHQGMVNFGCWMAVEGTDTYNM